MQHPQLSVQYINRFREVLPHALSADEKLGTDDLFRFYNPFGPVRKVVTTMGARGTTQAYVGYGVNYDLDHVLRGITGMTGLSPELRRRLYGGGKSHTLPGMFLSSIGEIVERGLGSLQSLADVHRHVFGSYRELTERGMRCLGPTDIPLFAPEQYAQPDFMFEPFTEDTQLAWIEGRRLLSGETVWAPAQVVVIYYMRRPNEARIGYAASVGLATHINAEEALYHGIVEAFERDAVNLRWHARIPLDRLELDRTPSIDAFRRSLDHGLPGCTRFYLNSLDFSDVPVVTAIQLDERMTRYSYFAGGGADLDIDAALFSAFNELGQSERDMRLVSTAQSWQFARNIEWLFDVGPDATTKDLTNFLKVIPFYGHKVNRPRLHRYLEAGPTVPLSKLPKADYQSPAERWQLLERALRKYKIDPLIFDFTPPQFSQLRTLKAFIPELIPAFPPSMPILGHPRFYEVPERMGFANRRLTFADLETEPLPYP